MARTNHGIQHAAPHASVEKAEMISRAWRFRALGQLSEAADHCERVLQLHPESDEGWHLLGLIRWDQGHRQSAASCLQRAVAIKPDQHQHHNTIGVMFIKTGEYDSAVASLNEALRLSPESSDSRSNLGLALFHQNRPEQARQCFEKVLEANPGHSEAWANLGLVHLSSGRWDLATQAYAKALAGNPDHPSWQGNLGAALLAQARFTEAAQCFKSALRAAPENHSYGVNLAIALRAMGNWNDSIAVLEHVLCNASGYGPALANLAVAYQQTCRWSELEPVYRQLDRLLPAAIENGQLPDEQPLMNLRRCPDPAVNLSVARAWSFDVQRRALKVAGQFRHQRGTRSPDRITIGYLSYDFRDHPVAHQLAPLFRLHDRSRFRVKAFSMGPDDGSDFRRAIEHDSDVFIDIARYGIKQAANLIAEHHVDILVDLMGHTHHNRMEIPALRPAPLQVGYLGFLGSSGADFMDYIIADDIVVPESHRQYYSEKIIRMPYCYQMNHLLWRGGSPSGLRRRFGLPEDQLVFCCFNQAYKIDRDLFASWLRILRQTPQAVLWLYRDHPMVVSRLRDLAADGGIHPERIIFADKLPLAQHMDRLQSVDLALDTIGYNGGATTANCLAAGVPVLTLMGTHWVSRMSASHLFSAGLADMVVPDLASYERKAVDLALQPEMLRSIRKRLQQAHMDAALFRPAEFVRNLETGFELIWTRYRSGHAPDDIRLERSASSPSALPIEGATETSHALKVEK